MANVGQTNFSHTYNGAELITEIFYQPEENNPSVEELYRVMDVRDKKNIYLPQELRKIFRVDTNGCGFTAAGGTFNINDKTISTEKIKANLELCVEEFIDTIWSEVLKRGVDINDLAATDIDEMVRTQITKATRSDIHRLVWFADADDADADWTQFDGWISLFLDASADIGASCFIDMDSTAFESSDALAAGGALGLLRQMYENATASLRSASNKRFYVTYTVLNNLMTSYEDTQSSSGLNLLINGQGMNQLSFRGIPVIAVPEWDVHLADTTNPHYTGSGLSIGSNLIVFTTPDNLIVGTDTVTAGGTTNQFKFRYADDDDEKLKIIAKMKLGAQFVHPELVCVAY